MDLSVTPSSRKTWLSPKHGPVSLPKCRDYTIPYGRAGVWTLFTCYYKEELLPSLSLLTGPLCNLHGHPARKAVIPISQVSKLRKHPVKSLC